MKNREKEERTSGRQEDEKRSEDQRTEQKEWEGKEGFRRREEMKR